MTNGLTQRIFNGAMMVVTIYGIVKFSQAARKITKGLCDKLVDAYCEKKTKEGA